MDDLRRVPHLAPMEYSKEAAAFTNAKVCLRSHAAERMKVRACDVLICVSPRHKRPLLRSEHAEQSFRFRPNTDIGTNERTLFKRIVGQAKKRI